MEEEEEGYQQNLLESLNNSGYPRHHRTTTNNDTHTLFRASVHFPNFLGTFPRFPNVFRIFTYIFSLEICRHVLGGFLEEGEEEREGEDG